MKKKQFFKRYLVLGFLTVFVSFCSQGEVQEIPDLAKGFALSGGAPISTPSTDDYNPVVIARPDNFLILIFGSDRSNATGGGPSGYHNIWYTVSMGPYDPFADGYPPFQVPTKFTPTNMTADSETERIPFSAVFHGGGAAIGFTKPSTKDMYVAVVTDFSNGGPDSENTYQGPNLGTDRTGTIIGNTGLSNPGPVVFIYKESNSNTITVGTDAFIASGNVSDGTFDTEGVSDKSTIATVPTQVSGVPNSYFFTNVDPSGFFSFILAGSGANVEGEPFSLNDGLFFAGLTASYISTFASPNGLTSGMAFSAGQGDINSPQDLFAVTSHDLIGLWDLIISPQQGIVGPGFDFLPPDIGGIETWYDIYSVFDTPGNPQAYWYDNMFNVDLIAGISGPAFEDGFSNAFGQPSVIFDGTASTAFDGAHDLSALPGSQMTVGTVFAVANFNNATFTAGGFGPTIIGDDSGTGFLRGSNGGTNIQTDITGGMIRVNGNPAGGNSATFAPLRLQKIITAYTTSAQAPNSAVSVGSMGGANYWNGEVSEIITYNRQLSTQEIEEVEKYLSVKYQIPLFSPVLGPNNANLVFWGRADEDAATVGGAAAFNDLAPGGWGNFTNAPSAQLQSTPAFTPGGPPVRAYLSNGSSMTNTGTGPNLAAQYTVLMVFKPNGGSLVSPQTLFDNHGTTGIEIGFNGAGPYDQIEVRKNGATQQFAGPPILEDQFQIVVLSGAASGAVNIFYNSISLGNMGGAFTPDNTGTTLFNGTLGQYTGYMAEILVYDTELTDPVRNEITCYMAQRYFVPAAVCQP